MAPESQSSERTMSLITSVTVDLMVATTAAACKAGTSVSVSEAWSIAQPRPGELEQEQSRECSTSVCATRLPDVIS